MKNVLCIIGLAVVGVFLTSSTVYACCGMYPIIADDPVVTDCMEDVTISGTITLTTDAPEGSPPGYYMPVAPAMTIEVSDPSGDVTTLTYAGGDITYSNWTYNPGPSNTGSATVDFSATFTPTEIGLHTYVKTAVDTYYGYSDSKSGEFTVWCLALDIKGGSCPNPLNRNAKGGTPVAILGSPEQLALLNLSSIGLMDEGGNLYSPMMNDDGTLMMTEEDSTQPGDYNAQDCYDCFEAPPTEYDAEGNIIFQYEGDGTDELVLKFDLREVDGDRGDCIVLTLVGELLDETPIEPVSDSMIIVK